MFDYTVPESFTLQTGEICCIPEGPFLKIEGQPFPFLLERIDEHGIHVSECRPYLISVAGYLRNNAVFKVLRHKKEIAEARWLLWRGWKQGIDWSEIQYTAHKETRKQK